MEQGDTTPSANAHIAAELKMILVDPDDIVLVMERNARDEHEPREHIIRIEPPFEGIRQATVASKSLTEPSTESTPKSLDLHPSTFINGRRGEQLAATYFYPDRTDARRRFENQQQMLPDDLPPEAEQTFEDWWEIEIDVWAEKVKAALEPKLTIKNRDGVATTIDVEYTADSSL